MKRTERQHLKDNELANSLSAARDFIEPRTKQITGAVVGLIVLLLAVGGVFLWQQRSATEGDELLAEAMVALNARVVPATDAADTSDIPAAASFGATGAFSSEEAKLNAAVPKLKAAADAHPDSVAGITARYHLAGAYAQLGRHTEAIAAFDEVVKRAGGSSLYGQMARLGKADSQASGDQLDAAITSWKELADAKDSQLPQDAILMELGRAYVQKGNKADAKKAYTQLVEQHPDSPYTAEARQEIEKL